MIQVEFFFFVSLTINRLGDIEILVMHIFMYQCSLLVIFNSLRAFLCGDP